MKKLSIVIPCYNEEKTIVQILSKINDVNLLEETNKEVLIVNDCSTDSSEVLFQTFFDKHPELSIKYLKTNIHK